MYVIYTPCDSIYRDNCINWHCVIVCVCVCYRSKPFCQAGGTAPRPYHVVSSIGGYPRVWSDSVVIEKSTMDVLQMYFCELETYGSMVIFRQFCVCVCLRVDGEIINERAVHK